MYERAIASLEIINLIKSGAISDDIDVVKNIFRSKGINPESDASLTQYAMATIELAKDQKTLTALIGDFNSATGSLGYVKSYAKHGNLHVRARDGEDRHVNVEA